MPVFSGSDQLNDVLQALFARVAEGAPGVGDAIAASHLVIRLRCTEPDAEVILDGRRRPVQVYYGPAGLRPTLDIELAADTLHAILADELSLKAALASGLLKVRGPVWKVTVLAEFFYQGQTLYPELVRDLDLVPAG